MKKFRRYMLTQGEGAFVRRRVTQHAMTIKRIQTVSA